MDADLSAALGAAHDTSTSPSVAGRRDASGRLAETGSGQGKNEVRGGAATDEAERARIGEFEDDDNDDKDDSGVDDDSGSGDEESYGSDESDDFGDDKTNDNDGTQPPRNKPC
jgi:hypothetical protein